MKKKKESINAESNELKYTHAEQRRTDGDGRVHALCARACVQARLDHDRDPISGGSERGNWRTMSGGII